LFSQVIDITGKLGFDLVDNNQRLKECVTVTDLNNEKKNWIEPEINELDVMETFAFTRLGADVGGNPDPDCQRS
jgi:hypothetical protein